MTQAIVTKTGNSYALRVPKSYIVTNQLRLGDRVTIPDPTSLQQKALLKLSAKAQQSGAIKGIENPVKWQKQQRLSSDPWEQL